jgi:hypothetical protein
MSSLEKAVSEKIVMDKSSGNKAVIDSVNPCRDLLIVLPLVQYLRNTI